MFLEDSTNITGQGTEVITINPGPDFEPGINYYMIIGEGFFVDTSGNEYAGVTLPTDYNFETSDSLLDPVAPVEPDRTAPTITSYSPTDDAGSVPVDANLVLDFPENVLTAAEFPGSKPFRREM